MIHRARLRASIVALVPALALVACEPPAAAPPPAAPAQPTAEPAPPSAAAPAAPAPSPAKPSGYSGLGVSSVAPELLAKYAPTPLPAEVSRHIQTMLDVRAPSAGRLSPDGKTLYFVWTITGTRQVWRLDGPRQFPLQLTGGEDATMIAHVTPDGKKLILLRDRKGEENPGVYVQDAKGGPLTVVQHKPGVQTFAEFVTDDARYLFYRANDVKKDSYAIYRYDLEKGGSERVFDQDGLWTIADHRPDGRLLLEKNVGSHMTEYSEWDPKTKKLTALFGQGEKENYVARYGAADGEVIVLTPKVGDFRRLHAYKGGKFTPISPELKWDIEAFEVDEARTRILYDVNEGGYLRLRGMDAKTFKDVALPALPPSDHAIIGASTRDGRFTTVSVDTGQAPPQSYVIDWKGKKITAWHQPSAPELETTRFARKALEHYVARDGTKIPMFVRRPASCEPKPCPVVVEFHGGPEGQALAGFSTRGQLFVDAGFVFVEPNVRGSTGYGKAWTHADDGAKRLDVITDIEDVAKFIREKWAVDGKAPKLGITGGSYGGYSTLVGMTMFAGAYDAGAEIVGISNLVTFLENTAPYRRILRTTEYGDPEKDREALVKLSPITHIDKVKAPMLLIQGANDPRVPVGEAVQIHDALTAKNLSSRLMIFADEGHGAQKRENQVLMLGHMLAFFQEHLQGKKR